MGPARLSPRELPLGCVGKESDVRLRTFYRTAAERLEQSLNEVDRKAIGKLSECAEYVERIFGYLRDRELVTYAKDGYLQGQSELTERHRGALVDWLVETHGRLELSPECLYLAVSLVDRFLEKDKLSREKLQLLGATALLIAAKYEEIYPPHIQSFLRSMDKPHSKDEMLTMELNILQRLGFDISVPTVLRFVERYAKLLHTDDTGSCLALYLAELQLTDYKMLKYPPSALAAAGLYIAQKALKKTPAFNELVATQSKLTETAVLRCAKDMLSLALLPERVSFFATRRKYLAAKFKEAARVRLDPTLLS